MNTKKQITIVGLVATTALAIGLVLPRIATAQDSPQKLKYEAVNCISISGGAPEEARQMTRVLNERVAAGWRFVSVDRAILIFSKE